MAEGNKTGALRALIMEAEKGVKPFFLLILQVHWLLGNYLSRLFFFSIGIQFDAVKQKDKKTWGAFKIYKKVKK